MIDLAWSQQERPEDDDERDEDQRDTDEQEARRVIEEELDLLRHG
jgi:hypothetical protein